MAAAKVPRRPRVQKFGFEASSVGDNSDLALLPRRFDLFATEVREGLDAIGKQFLPILNRLESAFATLLDRQTQTERTVAAQGAELAALTVTVRELDRARRIAKSRKRP